MAKLIIIALVGAGIGALIGRTRSCKTGACPLTSTPLGGAVYGGALALVVGIMVTGRQQGVPAGGDHDTLTSANVTVIAAEDEFKTSVLESDVPVLVDFYADWCGPCRRLMPRIYELADELAVSHPGAVRVVKINVDDNKDLAGRYGVKTIPDVRVFSGGKSVEQLNGLKSKEAYLDALTPYIKATKQP